MKMRIVSFLAAIFAVSSTNHAATTGVPVAWVRFDESSQSFEGSAYHWLGDSALGIEFDVKPATNVALELSWGAKGDGPVDLGLFDKR